MKNALRRSLPFAFTFSALATEAFAHPGHDGHELTWDLGHLVTHPLATLGCAVVLLVGAWAVAQLLESGAGRVREVVRQRRSDRRE